MTLDTFARLLPYGLVFLFVALAPFAIRSTRRQRERERVRWAPFAAAAAAHGWSWTLRPIGERLPPGLDLPYSRDHLVHWRIRGAACFAVLTAAQAGDDAGRHAS